MAETLVLSNPTFAAFAFYCSILLLKLVLMSPWTGRHRLANSVFPSPEDYKMEQYKEKEKVGLAGHPDVERVRRAHRNDLENILPFILIGFLYVLCNPPQYAVWFFRVFTIVRVLYSIVYLNAIKPPTRGIFFLTGLFINITMAVQILLKTAKL